MIREILVLFMVALGIGALFLAYVSYHVYVSEEKGWEFLGESKTSLQPGHTRCACIEISTESYIGYFHQLLPICSSPEFPVF